MTNTFKKNFGLTETQSAGETANKIKLFPVSSASSEAVSAIRGWIHSLSKSIASSEAINSITRKNVILVKNISAASSEIVNSVLRATVSHYLLIQVDIAEAIHAILHPTVKYLLAISAAITESVHVVLLPTLKHLLAISVASAQKALRTYSVTKIVSQAIGVGSGQVIAYAKNMIKFVKLTSAEFITALKTPNKAFSVSEANTANSSSLKRLARELHALSAESISVVKFISKIISNAQSQAVGLLKKFGKNYAIAEAQTVAVAKSLSHSSIESISNTQVLKAIKNLGKSVAYEQYWSINIVKNLGKAVKSASAQIVNLIPGAVRPKAIATSSAEAVYTIRYHVIPVLLAISIATVQQINIRTTIYHMIFNPLGWIYNRAVKNTVSSRPEFKDDLS